MYRYEDACINVYIWVYNNDMSLFLFTCIFLYFLSLCIYLYVYTVHEH